MSGTRAAWHAATRVLAVRLDTLGDVLMTTPAIRALKGRPPRRHVTLLTSGAGAAAARLVDEVDEVIVYDAPWLKATARRADAHADRAMAARLRRLRFDAAVIFTVYSQNPLPSAMLCFLADIPLRLAHCRENPYQLLTDWVPETEPDRTVRHEVRRQLDLVAAVGCRTDDERLSMRVPDAARRAVRARVAAVGLADREWVVVHPGATAASRRYPPEAFASACRRLALERGSVVVFTGDAGERPLIERIRAMLEAPSVSLAGLLTLPELAALLADAPLLISNNTGPVHVAAAVGTPVVDLYALTNPQHTPWAVAHRVLNHDVPCKYCYKSVCPAGHHACLRGVEPAAVVAAAHELLGPR
ncbi:MAG TPA: lipopolysaccharide heptosyltransferase II [Terriglobales bacterium]|nr:lipopolysaccharide heptosyltransferase II [Terriglobales bacterium]